jgi:hypothetical protein
LRVGADLAGLPGGDDVAGVLRSGGGGFDRSAGSGSGNADAVLEIGVQVGDGVDGRVGRLDVEEVVDAVPAARGVASGYRSPQMAILNCESDQPTGPTGDMSRQAPAEPLSTDLPVRIRRDDLMG